MAVLYRHIHKIILIQESGELFTGPFACQMLESGNRGKLEQHSNKKWKFFTLQERNKQGLVLKKGSEILFQVVHAYIIVKSLN